MRTYEYIYLYGKYYCGQEPQYGYGIFSDTGRWGYEWESIGVWCLSEDEAKGRVKELNKG